MALRICFVSAEVTPLAKTGGLADVTGALTRLLHALGHDVRLFAPFYGQIARTGLEWYPVDFLQNMEIALGAHRYPFSVSTVRMPGSSMFIYLIECPELFERSAIYTTAPDEHLRFLLLTRAAFECCQRMAWSPQILHCHDWHAAFGPLFLKTLYAWDQLFKETRSVLTIHNIGYQGIFGAKSVADLGLGTHPPLLHQDDLRAGVINPLKHGVMYADVITTVSPTYAQEIRTPQYGMGLETALRLRGDAVLGILNGVDYEEWDPARDRYISHPYRPAELAKKAQNKREFLTRMNLHAGPRTPLAGIITRMTVQKGLELILESLPDVLRSRDLVFAALGNGDAHYEEFFTQLQQDFPHRVAFHRGYSNELAHWIEAASDLYLMPSQYEPCGLNQLYSLKYGTVPVVRRTGGLADSVKPYDPATGSGTGILFDDFTPEAMQRALYTALDLYAQPEHWERMVRNGMRDDFSWEKQGSHYVDLYQRLLGM